MNASAIPTIGSCTSCLRSPRLLDPDSGACAPCLTRDRQMVEFFRLARTVPAFRSYAKRSVSRRTRQAFAAMFGTERQFAARPLRKEDEEDCSR